MIAKTPPVQPIPGTVAHGVTSNGAEGGVGDMSRWSMVAVVLVGLGLVALAVVASMLVSGGGGGRTFHQTCEARGGEYSVVSLEGGRTMESCDYSK